MSVGFFKVPAPVNEPVKNYAPGSAERKELQDTLAKMKSEVYDIPMYINGQEIRTGNTVEIRPPHETKHLLGHYHRGTKEHVTAAIDAALKAKSKWENLSWEQRSAIFLKAADLIAGPYRAKINAATMLGQSKSVYQAEIDAACELIDFLRFNFNYLELLN
jgi:1-pyrroline-5-carboxylate dehydrogenase